LLCSENTRIYDRNKFLFLEGDIEENVTKIIKELGWEQQLSDLKKSL